MNDIDIFSVNNKEISTTMLQRKLSPKKYKEEIELVMKKVEDINLNNNNSSLIRRISSFDTVVLEKKIKKSHNNKLNT